MSETKTEGSFKIKAPQKKEPVAEQKVEAPVKKAVEEKAEPKKDINPVASINEESGNIKLDLNIFYVYNLTTSILFNNSRSILITSLTNKLYSISIK